MFQDTPTLPAIVSSRTLCFFSKGKKLLIISLIALLLLSFGCATSTPPYRHGRGTGSYTVLGKTYYPLRSAKGFRQKGFASYYAEQFHGEKTASGERFNMHAMTCAHTILPFDTILRVTNLDNKRSVTVRVNDRGPFKDDRIIDLSKEAAKRLGFIGKGTARVAIVALEKNEERTQSEEKNRSNTANGDELYVQVGSFSKQQNANACKNQLIKKGFKARIIHKASERYLVQAGPFQREEALISLALLRMRFRDALLIDKD
ncbi:MAG: septal ring lytic transglycosylase RlpA family protein [Desulfovibrio sp.]|nr:septal ring lytic transglycosylase RlpA family protein [Desulfovibrio sp.]